MKSSAYSGIKWSIQSYNFDLSLDETFFLNISSDSFTAGEKNIVTRTNFFKISAKAQDTAGTTCTSSPCPTNKSTTTPSGQNSKMIEIGLGIGLGIPLGIALISILFLVKRLRESRKNQLGGQTNNTPLATQTQHFSYQETPMYGQVHEISTRNEVHEAPGGGTTIRNLMETVFRHVILHQRYHLISIIIHPVGVDMGNNFRFSGRHTTDKYNGQKTFQEIYQSVVHQVPDTILVGIRHHVIQVHQTRYKWQRETRTQEVLWKWLASLIQWGVVRKPVSVLKPRSPSTRS